MQLANRQFLAVQALDLAAHPSHSESQTMLDCRCKSATQKCNRNNGEV